MDLDTAVLLVEGGDEERMLRALTGWEPTGHVVPADLGGMALASAPAVGSHAGWALLVDPGLGLAFDRVTAGLATRGSRGIAAVWQQATDTHAFDLYEDGMRTRGQVWSAGTMVSETGAPLPEEQGLDWEADAEDALAELVARVSGVDLRSGELLEVRLRTLRERPALR